MPVGRHIGQRRIQRVPHPVQQRRRLGPVPPHGDRALVQLLAERQRYMDAAARIKPDRSVVHDDARIEDVVQKVLAAAARAGLSPAIAEPVWRLLIDRCIAHEFEAFDRTRG